MNPKSKSFSLGLSIVIPEKGVRYVYYGRGKYKLFHSNPYSCNNRDTKGFCNGHDIGREEFTKKYCNGIVPEQMEIAPAVFTRLEHPRDYMSGEECLKKYRRYKELRALGLNQRDALTRLDINPHSASSFLAKVRRLLTKEETKKEVKKNDYNRIF